jgi:hypothetical protein
MWAALTWNNNQFELPIASLFSNNRFTDRNGGQHASINLLDVEERLAVGVVEYIEVNYDQTTRRSSGSNDVLDTDAGTVTRTHTTVLAGLEPLKVKRLGELAGYWKSVQRRGIVSSLDMKLQTDVESVDEVTVTARWIDQGGALPGGYRWIDMEDELQAMSSANMLVYADELAGHFKDCRINYNAHVGAINALSSQQSVIDYNITTGWPTDPFPPPEDD